MKKRVLSMFMALALCLTLLPAPAWAAEADAPDGRVAPEAPPAQADFVDGPFASYMALLGHGEQAGCPPLFCRRLADAAPELAPQLAQDMRVQARLAAVMALVVSAVWDKLEEFEILAD